MTSFSGIISTFLHVHPFGASIEYICSYLQRLDTKVKRLTWITASTVEQINRAGLHYHSRCTYTHSMSVSPTVLKYRAGSCCAADTLLNAFTGPFLEMNGFCRSDMKPEHFKGGVLHICFLSLRLMSWPTALVIKNRGTCSRHLALFSKYTSK